MTKSKIEEWFTLSWRDGAGREQSMTGPHYALEDHASELKKLGVAYDLEVLGTVETVEPKPSKVKEVAGKDLEVR